MAAVSSWIPPSLPDADGYDGPVLLDRWCYIGDLPNGTIAAGETSTGLRIEVTFHAARPPLLSYFCVHCPGLDFRTEAPRVVATDADLVLLLVPVDPDFTATGEDWDHFVYTPRAHRLDLLPNPCPDRWIDYSATALLSRHGGTSYVVAALGVRPPVGGDGGRLIIRWEFDLHLYRSSDSSEGEWISKILSVDDLVRDKFIPLPDSVDRLYHETAKTVVLGGERGTVAWVDLWRGIFLCDVLEECPVLQDIPLPAPARGNWDRLIDQYDPNYLRDVTVNPSKDTIKYIEMEEFSSSREVNIITTPASSYVEWVRMRNNPRKSRVVVTRDGWKATTWSMPLQPVVGSSEGWHLDCELDSKYVTLDASDSSQLSVLSRSEIPRTLEELPMVYPTICMHDDVVYFLSRSEPRDMDKLEVVFAVDVRKGTLQGLAELDVQKDFFYMPAFCTSEICRYLRNIADNLLCLLATSEAAVKRRSELSCL